MPLEKVIVNEGSILSYPEIMPNATRWVYGKIKDAPETIVVAGDGLRELLKLIHDFWPVVAGFYLRDISPEITKMLYAKAMTQDNLRDLMNRTSAVWCEGDLIVSGLFVIDGKVLHNKTGESSGERAGGHGGAAGAVGD